jgi:hypothetical protein
MSDAFPIHNDLKQGETLSSLLYKMLSGSSRKNQERMELNGTHQLLVYADDDNLLGRNRKNVNKKEEALSEASREAGQKVNTKLNICLCLITRMLDRVII